MDLHIRYPDDFPLHGIERDAFEAKLRDAFHDVFDGRRVQRLAGHVDARRPASHTDELPLRRIGDKHAFEECLTLDGCRFDHMSAPLRRRILTTVATRIGLELAGPGAALISAQPVAGEVDSATNRRASPAPTIHRRPGVRSIAPALVVLAMIAGAGAVWEATRRALVAGSLAATVVSTSPAQTLRELADSIPDDRRPYRLSVQVEPQGAPARDVTR